MKKAVFLLSLMMIIFNAAYTLEQKIEDLLYKQWSFSVKNKSVYYGSQKLSGLDYSSFEVLNDYYLKDKNGIYFIKPQIIVTSGETLEGDENFKNENWYEDKEIDQWYGIEMETEKIPQAGSGKYVLDGQYMFGGGYAVNRGKIIYLGKNVPFKIDMKTLKIIDTDLLECEESDLECLDHKNILIRDKNGVYGVIDGESGTEIYKIEGIDALSFEKTGTRHYRDKNKSYALNELDEKAVKMEKY